jgi:hypothetical protein
VVEHVAHSPAELLGALGIPFGHRRLSDTLDIRINGLAPAALRLASLRASGGIRIAGSYAVKEGAVMADQKAITDLFEKMAEQRDALLAEAEALSDEAASYAPPDGEGEAGWSPKQQLAHLAEMEVAYRGWVQRALVEDNPDVTSGTKIDPPGIRLEAAAGSSVADLTAQLRAEREITISMMKALSPEQYDRTATQKMFGQLTVLQWLRSYYRHDRMHRDQMAGRDPEYKPKFVGGREPDQRRGQRI